MTKEEYIKKLTDLRKQGYEEPKNALCDEVACSDCYFACDPCNGNEVINVLLDHIIDHEAHQETNLEHYWDNLHVHFDPRQVDGYLAFIERNMNVKEWLLQPYQPKQRYMMDKLTYGIVKQWAEVNEIYRSDEAYGSDLFDILYDLGLWNDSWGDVKQLDMWEFADNAEVIDSE